jgi:tetratricopeptide (TPR) repeat protein
LLGPVVRRPGRALAVAVLLALTAGGLGLAAVYGGALYELRAARTALARHHNREGYEHAQACLAAWPHSGAALLAAARAAYRLGRFDEAEQCLGQYQALHGKDDDLFLEGVLLHVTEGQVDEFRKFCDDRVERNDPAAPLLLEALARGNQHLFRTHDAAACLDEWQRRWPDDPQAAYCRGLLLEQGDRVPDAIASYRRVLEIDPGRDDARLHLGDLLVALGQAAEALPHLEYLCRRQPDNLEAQVDLARCQDRLGHPEEAVRLLDGVLARRPEFGPALAERGRLALQAGQAAAAETYLRQASRLQPGDATVHYQLAQALAQNGKAEEAKAVQARLKQIEQDLKDIQNIVNVQMPQRPHDPQLHYEAGMIALRAGAPDEALRWFESALREDPRHAATHEALASYYQALGQRGRAARHRELARQAAAAAPAPPSPGPHP